MTKFRILTLAGLAVVASMGAALAAERTAVRGEQFFSLYQVQGPMSAISDISLYNHSGSRGRLDLGASPLHPEGPGNFSD